MVSNLKRISCLKRRIEQQGCIRVIESHSPIAALLAERARVDNEGDDFRQYDAFWSSSLTDSAISALPDTEFLSIDTRLRRVADILDATTLPMLFDCDTGGPAEHFSRRIPQFERLGLSGVVIEDKIGFKRNSLIDDHRFHQQATIEGFCEKLTLAKFAKTVDDFMVVARCESLILGAGLEDALMRCTAYVDAGADAVLIHSKSRTADEVFAFARAFKQQCPNIILICVPSTYNHVHFADFRNEGFNAVIYANQVFRAAFSAIQKVANDILHFDRTLEVDQHCEPIGNVLDLFTSPRS
jgi:phosphoenolpyruvate phosphomutase